MTVPDLLPDGPLEPCVRRDVTVVRGGPDEWSRTGRKLETGR